MYYMSDHISAVPGIKALLPTKHDTLGQYKISVTEKDFQRIRAHLQKYIKPWYDQFVEPDARNPESKFPGPSTVASIEADDYSEDEQSYMTVSVNTALSLTTVLSDDTLPESAGIPKTVTQNRSWADDASDSSQNSRAIDQTPQRECDPKTSDIISALSTSQAQVDLLKAQVAELRAEREETANTIAEAVKKQVEQILATRTATINEDHIAGQQFNMFVPTQDRKIDALTSMFTQMMTAQQQFYQAPSRHLAPTQQDTETTFENKGPTLGKRNAIGDLDEVYDADRMETDDQETSRKRSDSRQTPQKAPQPVDSQPMGKHMEPRQLLPPSSPRRMPLPESPPSTSPSRVSAAPESPESMTTEIVPPAKADKRTKYQQQSMSRYLHENTPTRISNPPEVNRVTNTVPEDFNQASLSAAEDESYAQGSGNESETPATPISNNRRRGSTRTKS